MLNAEKKLKYMQNEEIEKEVERLLLLFKPKALAEPMPISIEIFIQTTLNEMGGTDIEIMGRGEEEYRDDGLLGKYVIEANIIMIKQWLYESRNIRDQRIKRFTYGHEAGHAILHGDVLRAKLKEPDLFRKRKIEELLTLKRTIEKPQFETDYIERQANYFGAAILMPRKAVKRALLDLGYEMPIIVKEGRIDEDNLFKKALNIATDLYDLFDVNKSAMAYRLMQLELITFYDRGMSLFEW